jgi:hypothetical protein
MLPGSGWEECWEGWLANYWAREFICEPKRPVGKMVPRIPFSPENVWFIRIF